LVMLLLLGGFSMTKRKKSGPLSSPRKESGQVNTPKATVTIENFLEELNNSGRKFSKSNKGHQALLRDTLQTAQRIILKLLDSETLQKQFVRAVKKEKKVRKKSGPFNWPLEVVAKATGASSRKTRKLASKRCGALEFLREREVPVKDTAATLKKEGIEKLYSEWCKKKKQRQMAAANKPPSTPDGKVMLALWLEPSDRDQLMDQEEGAKLTVLVSRVSESDGDFHVKRVVRVDSLGEEDEDEDWEESEE
jgi:hypothetical protein